MLSLQLNSQYVLNVQRAADSVDSSMQKLSSGVRINSSEDDPAGTAIAEGLDSLVRGSQTAQQNIQNGINLVQIGEDGIQGMIPVLQRMRELVVQAGNGTYTDTQRQSMQQEIDQIKQLLPQAFYVAHDARINLDGKDNADRVLNFQVGAESGEIVSVDYNPLRDDMRQMILDTFGYAQLYNSQWQEFLVGGFGSPAPKPTDPAPPPSPPGTTMADAFPSKVQVVPGTDANINQSLSVIDTSITNLTAQASYLGAIQNRFEDTLNNVSSFQLDAQSSESTIRDTDMAQEMTKLTSAQVIQQAATAMLSQSNQQPFQILQLLKNSPGQ
ncbi:MAG TPA: flagellin [Oscillatoriaceae cyanobacterium]